MKPKTTAYILRGICVALAVFAVVYIILGYFVSGLDADREIRDGLGRLTDELPMGISAILPQWAGFVWFFIDCIIMLCVVLIIDKLLIKAGKYINGIKYVDY